MAWGRQTDSFDIDPDIDAFEIPEGALGLFWCSISYANRNLTDGAIPRTAVPKLPGGNVKLNIEKLVEAKWWVKTETGYMIRSFLAYNRSRQQVEEQRAQDAERQERHRKKVANNKVTDENNHDVETHVSHSDYNALSHGVTNSVDNSVTASVTNAPENATPRVPSPRVPESESRVPSRNPPSPLAAAPPQSVRPAGLEIDGLPIRVPEEPTVIDVPPKLDPVAAFIDGFGDALERNGEERRRPDLGKGDRWAKELHALNKRAGPSGAKVLAAFFNDPWAQSQGYSVNALITQPIDRWLKSAPGNEKGQRNHEPTDASDSRFDFARELEEQRRQSA